MMIQPLFKNAHNALTFAYNYSSQQYAPSQMGKLIIPPSGGKGLAGVDGAAQAGLIRSKVSQLGRIREAVLIARYSNQSIPCDCGSLCCSGKKLNMEWAQSIGTLAEYLKETELKNAATNQVMRLEYVRRFFVRRKSDAATLDEISEQTGVSKKTVISHSNIVKRFILGKGEESPGLERVAMMAIEGLLITDGVIENDGNN